MRKKLTVNLDKNPFIYFKIRNALLWFIVISFLVGIQYALIMCFTGQDINNLDPIFDMMFRIIIILLWIAYIVRKLTSYRLDWHRFVGKIPRNHDWLSFGLLGIMNYAFAIGTNRIIGYPISIFFPSWLHSKYTDATLLKAQSSFSPELYQITDYLSNIILIPILTLLFFIIIYRLSAKYGLKKTLFCFCLFIFLGTFSGFFNVLYPIIRLLIIILLYFRTRTLLVPVIYILLEHLLSSIWMFINQQMYLTETSDFVTRFQSQLGLGIILTVISAPYLIYWLRKNWFRQNEQLPYFVKAE